MQPYWGCNMVVALVCVGGGEGVQGNSLSWKDGARGQNKRSGLLPVGESSRGGSQHFVLWVQRRFRALQGLGWR